MKKKTTQRCEARCRSFDQRSLPEGLDRMRCSRQHCHMNCTLFSSRFFCRSRLLSRLLAVFLSHSGNVHLHQAKRELAATIFEKIASATVLCSMRFRSPVRLSLSRRFHACNDEFLLQKKHNLFLRVGPLQSVLFPVLLLFFSLQQDNIRFSSDSCQHLHRHDPSSDSSGGVWVCIRCC